jgi:predicted GNAT superfamily acetyltransferase
MENDMFVVYFEDDGDYDDHGYTSIICVVNSDDEERAKRIIELCNEQAKDSKLHTWIKKKYKELGFHDRMVKIDKDFRNDQNFIYENLTNKYDELNKEFFTQLDYDILDKEAFGHVVQGCIGFWRDMKNGSYEYKKVDVL